MSELSQHDQIVQAFNQYLTEAETFDEKGVKAAAARARKALGDLGKLTKSRRAEIQDKRTECNVRTAKVDQDMGSYSWNANRNN